VHDAEGVALGLVRQHAAVDPAAPVAVVDVVQQALGRQEAATAVGDASKLQPLLQRAALVLCVVKELERHRARSLGLGRVDAQVEDELVHVLQREEPLLPLDDDLARRPARPRLVRHQHLRLESARRRHLPVGRPRVRAAVGGGLQLSGALGRGGLRFSAVALKHRRARYPLPRSSESRLQARPARALLRDLLEVGLASGLELSVKYFRVEAALARRHHTRRW